MAEQPKTTVKFLCSYGGKILPRPSDARLRYVGGLTRVVSVPRSISFSELSMKLGELCGHAVSIRCQLPNEDLDVLVSIKSDDDVANVIEEYDKASASSGRELKIRTILSPPRKSSSSSSLTSLSSSSSASSSPDISPSNRHLKPPASATAVIRWSSPRRVQYDAVRDRFGYYPCHMQANFSNQKYSNHWH